MIHLHFHDSLNMGDALNYVMINELFGTFVKMENPPNSEMIAIGSILNRYIEGLPQYNRLWESCESSEYKDKLLHVWGAGLIEELQYSPQLSLRRPMQFHALRGEYTRSFMEKVVGQKIDCPLADPGLLATRLIEPQEKRFDLGIIPHYVEFDGFAFQKIHESYPNSIIIDIEGEPLEVLKQISQCNTIVSSALHGLIISDSFGIPNLWCRFSDKVIGDGYKFRDYYSSYNLPAPCFDISGGDIPSINDIIKSHKITMEMVKNKQEELIRAFPYDYELNLENQVFFSEMRKASRELLLSKREYSKVISKQKNAIKDLQNELAQLEQELAQKKLNEVSLENALEKANHERDVARKRVVDIEASTSWRISKPIRLLGDLRANTKGANR